MDPNAVQQSIIVGYIAREAIAWLKRSPHFAWINDATPTLSRWLSWLLTFVGSFGIVLACTGSAAGGWDCRLTIPPADQLRDFAMRWITAQMSAHVIYEVGKAGASKQQ